MLAFIVRRSLLVNVVSLAFVAGGGGPQLTEAELAAKGKAEIQHKHYAKRSLVILAAVVAGLALYQWMIYSVRYVRTLACLNNATQRYFRIPSPTFASIKQHFLYAPTFRKRHRQAFRFLNMNCGILPSRFQSIFFFGVIAMNIAFCTYGIAWQGSRKTALSQVRNRTGTLAVVNMIPLVVLAGRNNPLITFLNFSFDTFNLVHRLFGRVVAVQAVVHSIAHAMIKVDKGGWDLLWDDIQHEQFILTGFLGTVGMVFILLQASSIARHAFYEIFLHLHIALVILVIVALWYHLAGYHAQRYLLVVIVVWAFERIIRLVSLIYRNFGRAGTEAVVEALPGDAIRVNLRVARPWHFSPGQHLYITIPSIGLWTSHPFSVAWSEEESGADSEKGLALDRQDLLTNFGTTVSLVVRRRTGFTNKLFQKAEASPNGRIALKALVEGPYGSTQNLQSYGTVLLFAGGVGITHQVPFVRDLIAGFANGTVAARRVCLVWVIQSPEHLEWIRPWMTSILAMDKRRDVLRIQLFVTRPRSTKEIHSPSATVQMFPGKPNVDTLVQMECENQVGAMAVSVCGTGGLSDDVRNAVRRRQQMGNIDFFEETFSW